VACTRNTGRGYWPFKQVFIQAAFAKGILERGVHGAGAAGSHHYPVQVLLLDGFDDLFLGVRRAVIEIFFGVDHVGMVLAYSTTAGTFTTRAMLVPQRQDKDAYPRSSAVTSLSSG